MSFVKALPPTRLCAEFDRIRACRRASSIQAPKRRGFATTAPSTLKLLALSSAVAIALASPSLGSPAGDAAEDIIDGCNQFIKFARKGYSREDIDTMRHLGECMGAVRTMLATEIASDNICPMENVKLIDAVVAFSLYMIQHPSDLKTVYVVPMREAFRKAYPCTAIRQ